MADCRNCIHKRVCDLWHEKELQKACSFQLSGCDYFKDQSLFMELPCKIGKKIYVIDWCSKRYKGYGCPCKCGSTQREHVFGHDCVKYCMVNSRGFCLDDVDRIGKDVFLTKADAKNAIIERAEENAND